MVRFQDAAVRHVFAAYPPKLRKRLLNLRQMIFEVAKKTKGVGKLQETLRWGEPAYITAESGSGTTIRIHCHRNQNDRYAMYVHCQTTLIATFKELFPGTFTFEGSRCIVFNETERVPIRKLKLCIMMALMYRTRREQKKRTGLRKVNGKINRRTADS